MVIFIVLVLVVFSIIIYGNYVGFWGKSLERPVREGQIKVACIGDSITYGMRVKIGGIIVILLFCKKCWARDTM